MSARKITSLESPQHPVTVEARQERLTLSHEAVVIHKSGIEFRSPMPLTTWTEMTVELATRENGRVNCTGVVIACAGNKHTGYHVSMIFTNISRQAQTRLTRMSDSPLG
jgi:hypothetical protein